MRITTVQFFFFYLFIVPPFPMLFIVKTRSLKNQLQMEVSIYTNDINQVKYFPSFWSSIKQFDFFLCILTKLAWTFFALPIHKQLLWDHQGLYFWTSHYECGRKHKGCIFMSCINLLFKFLSIYLNWHLI